MDPPTLDYLVGEGQLAIFDKQTLRQLQEIEQLPEAQREKLAFKTLYSP